MKNTNLVITGCLTLILLTSVVGCRHHKSNFFGPKVFNDRIELMTKILSKELKLTDEQNRRLNLLKDEVKVKFQDQKIHMKETLTVIHEEILKDSIDRQRLEKLFDDRKQSREDMHSFMLNKFTEFHALLTKEQRIKLNELIGKMEKEFTE